MTTTSPGWGWVIARRPNDGQGYRVLETTVAATRTQAIDAYVALHCLPSMGRGQYDRDRVSGQVRSVRCRIVPMGDAP